MNIIENRIEAINKINALANKIVPLIRKDIEKNGFKLKTGVNEFYAKDKERIQAIYKPLLPEKGVQAWIDISKYADPARLTLEIRTSYRTSDEAVNYYTGYFPLNLHPFEMQPIYDVQEMIEKDKEATQMMEKAQELKSSARAIQYITRGR
jgi:hypothetical protein